MAFTLDTTIGDLMKHPQAVALLDHYMPGFQSHPMFGMAQRVSLRTVAGMSGGKITPEMLDKLEARLAALD